MSHEQARVAWVELSEDLGNNMDRLMDALVTDKDDEVEELKGEIILQRRAIEALAQLLDYYEQNNDAA